MAVAGAFCLFIAFVAVGVGAVLLFVGGFSAKRNPDRAESSSWLGKVAAWAAFAALTLCCLILVICFFNGDNTIEYVAKYRSNSSSGLRWLYLLSGLWGGRQGSLLFWAWLISAFGSFVALRHRGDAKPLDTWALFVVNTVVAMFVGVLLFSSSNMPFTATASNYLDASGKLIGTAATWGLNPLLEHWAMAVHPPALFVGYAGLTIPFAYAIAALIANDDSDAWVLRCNGITSFSWFFLGLGIGLGAIWAYVVLGWGGYWGWDPVENASLLSWLVCVALMHSFTLYRRRGLFKRWSIMCACIAFAFVIVGTFISRSGLVQSVHAFEGDAVSLVLFAALIIISLLAGVVGLVIRRRDFGTGVAADEPEASFTSREMAYYLNNVIMVVLAFLIAYLTICSALPSWMPFGGQTISTETYESIAYPVGILVMAIIAVCPLLGWHKTDPADFRKKALKPGICAIVLFALLAFYWATALVPAYNATIAYGGSTATKLAGQGPAFYYNGLALIGFAVASCLFFNSLFMLGKLVGGLRKSAAAKGWRKSATTLGGLVAHTAMAIILIGLIGSSMYVTERTGYVSMNDGSSGHEFIIGDYKLVPTAVTDSAEEVANNTYSLDLDVYQNGSLVGHMQPAILIDPTTQQQKALVAIMGYPTHDLFVIYRGESSLGGYALDVRINPLVSYVWIGFVLLMAGTAIAMLGRRSGSSRSRRIEGVEGELDADEESIAAVKESRRGATEVG